MLDFLQQKYIQTKLEGLPQEGIADSEGTGRTWAKIQDQAYLFNCLTLKAKVYDL